MKTPSGLSFIARASTIFFYYARKKIFGKPMPVEAKRSAFWDRLAGFFSAAIVFSVLAFGVFGTGYLIFKSLASHSEFSLIEQVSRFFEKKQINTAENSQIAETLPDPSAAVDIPVNIVEEINPDEIVNIGEEIRDAIYSQLRSQVLADPAKWKLAESYVRDEEKLKSFLDKKTSEIMADNGIIKKDGQILTVNPGTRVVLDLEGIIKIFGDSYFQNENNTSAEGLQPLQI